MILKTVYKKNGDKIQKWFIEVEGNKYRTTEGFVDGAMTTSEWTKVIGKNLGKKNETSPTDQAVKEAGAKYRLKLDKGYKEDIEDISTPIGFGPMLAHKYEDHKAKVTYPCFVQPKLDGMRCPIRQDGAYSRQGKPVEAVPHIIEALKQTFQESPGCVIDGELYNHKLKDDFNALISICKKKKLSTADLLSSRETLEFHVYDMYDPENPQATFEERFKDAQILLQGLPGIQLVRTFKVDSEEEMESMYERFQKEGYEGIMIRSNAPYQQKRTVNLLKRKEFQDDEFVITDIQEGVGNRSGMMGRFILITEAGETFEADASDLGGHAAYKKILENKQEYIGEKATVRYQNLTPDRKVPRFGKVIAIRDYD